MNLRFLTAGESHGPALTAILDGMPAGLPLNQSMINAQLARRQRGFGAGERMKIEQDAARLLGGVMAGETNGAPISFLVENADHIKWKGKQIAAMVKPRPGQADLTGAAKYGFRDLRPSLERASARETTMRVAVGAVCRQFLLQFGISIGGFVQSLGTVEADVDESNLVKSFEIAEKNELRCPDLLAEAQMKLAVEEVMRLGDTLGGVITLFAINVPVGLGAFSQWDKRLDAKLAHAVMSVQAIKGVEIGSAFENARLPGTKVQDEIRIEGKRLKRPTNRAGGFEGGITNGEPIIIHAAMKPIASTLIPQSTVDLTTGIPSPTKYERSDYCPVPRAVPVLEAMLAFVLADALIEKLGGDSLAEMRPRFEKLRQLRLDDLPMDNQPHVWWE